MRWLDDLLDLISPRYCPMCGERLMPTETVVCCRCDIQLPRLNMQNSHDNNILRTLWDEVLVYQAASFMYYRHESYSHQLLIQIKYRGNKRLAHRLGQMAASETAFLGIQDEVDYLVPVPLSPKRLRQRGYNQAEELARGISKEWNIPIRTDILTRTSDNETQTHLSATERALNAEGKYQAQVPEELRGKRFLLIDDVFTTGSTMKSCIKTMLKCDPNAKIGVFTLAWAR